MLTMCSVFLVDTSYYPPCEPHKDYYFNDTHKCNGRLIYENEKNDTYPRITTECGKIYARLGEDAIIQCDAIVRKYGANLINF